MIAAWKPTLLALALCAGLTGISRGAEPVSRQTEPHPTAASKKGLLVELLDDAPALGSKHANALNQYTAREVPGAVDIIGAAIRTNTVTVNGVTATRQHEYFWSAAVITNSSAAAWQPVTVAHDGTNVLTGNVFLPKTPEPFLYDADGNLTNDGRWTYTWDNENRLALLVANPNTPSASRKSLRFTYDWQGRRVSKVVSNWTGSAWAAGVTNKFLYDGWNLVAELNGTNGLVRSYLWGSDLSGGDAAGGVGGLLAIRQLSTTNSQPSTNFVAMDGNGNVAALVNAADGTVTATYEYGPFGELLRAERPMAKANPFRFSTKYQDEESDLVYYGLRYYRADTSRWLNRDPIGEDGGLNLYGFVGNDAVNQVDALGMSSSLNTPAGYQSMAWAMAGGVGTGITLRGYGELATQYGEQWDNPCGIQIDGNRLGRAMPELWHRSHCLVKSFTGHYTRSEASRVFSSSE